PMNYSILLPTVKSNSASSLKDFQKKLTASLITIWWKPVSCRPYKRKINNVQKQELVVQGLKNKIIRLKRI
ncbi:hypothetical protein BB561_006987, partial [Smittium simulii]